MLETEESLSERVNSVKKTRNLSNESMNALLSLAAVRVPRQSSGTNRSNVSKAEKQIAVQSKPRLMGQVRVDRVTMLPTIVKQQWKIIWRK